MYEERILVFVDILGFKNIIKETVQNNVEDYKKTKTISSFINRIYRDLDINLESSIKDWGQSIEEARESKGSVQVTQFSDSVVISFDYREKAAVFHVLMDLLFLYLSALEHGMLVRGAVVRGLVRHTEKELFGPAMVNAYELESKIANSPRTILSKEIIGTGIKYHNNTNTQKHEEQYILDLLKLDDDGYYFVDYFDAIEKELNNGFEDYPQFLLMLKNIILKSSQTTDERILQKMEWMKKYYNLSLKERKESYNNPELKPEYIYLRDFYQSENYL